MTPLARATEALKREMVSAFGDEWYEGDDAERLARIVLGAARVDDLVAALRKWTCDLYRESNVENEDGTYDVLGHDVCSKCQGTGLHPIASAALQAYEGTP